MNGCFTNLDAVKGLKQIERMRATLGNLKERYTAWVRMQKKAPLDRTVREDKFEKATRALIQRGKGSISTMDSEFERHRRIWVDAESCRMLDTTPFDEEDLDLLVQVWTSKIHDGMKKRSCVKSKKTLGVPWKRAKLGSVSGDNVGVDNTEDDVDNTEDDVDTCVVVPPVKRKWCKTADAYP